MWVLAEEQELPSPPGLFDFVVDWPTASSVNRSGFVESVDRHPQGEKELCLDLRWGLRLLKEDLN